MEQTNDIKVFIIDPDTGNPVDPATWVKTFADTKVAEEVLIQRPDGSSFLLSKHALGNDMKFNEAVEAAKQKGGTLGTRRQWLDIYDAIYGPGELNETLKLIGGDEIECQWCWTSETVQSSSNFAWIFLGTGGYLSNGARIIAYAARLFRASDI